MAQKEFVLEAHDNFQKQSLRNRTYIYSPNGTQMLTVPILHSKKEGHRSYKDVLVDDSFNWQKQHWKSLETAYRTSPFFEYYEDEIAPIFRKKHNFLMDLNLETMELVCECMQLPAGFQFTTSYETEPSALEDYRFLVNAKAENSFNFDPYVQVFTEKHGFIVNLSILDLLFNEGPNSITYLESQSIGL